MMNKDFEKLSIEANESDFNYNSGEIYGEQKEGLKKLLNELGEILLTFNIVDSVLKLTNKEKIRIKTKLNEIISNSFKKQGDLERKKINQILKDAISNNYYKKIYILSLGAKADIKKINDKIVEKIINGAVEGKNWTYRSWTNKKELENILKRDINRFLNGEITVNDIKAQVEKRFNTNAYVTNRLIDNEIARCQFEINDYFANEYGIEEQQFMAILDKRTTEKCRNLNGKVFKVNDPNKPKIPQDTHVGCRSCYVNIPSREWELKTENKSSIWKNYSKWYKEKVGD